MSCLTSDGLSVLGNLVCSGPIYPAKQVLVEVGHSPSTMRTVGGPYTMACTDMPQTFLLPPNLENAAVGKISSVACVLPTANLDFAVICAKAVFSLDVHCV